VGHPQLDLLVEFGPVGIVRGLAALDGRNPRVPAHDQPQLPHLFMPAHHDVRPGDVVFRRLHGALPAAAERGSAAFADLLLVPGVEARTVRSLAMVAEGIHGAPCRFADPAHCALAHGGKDRKPFLVAAKVYDDTIGVPKAAPASAKLGTEQRLDAIRRLDEQARRLAGHATDPSLDDHVRPKGRNSHDHGGRGVHD
jgi:uncharacterized protein